MGQFLSLSSQQLPPSVEHQFVSEDKEMRSGKYSAEQVAFLEYIKHRYDYEFVARTYCENERLINNFVSFIALKESENAMFLRGKHFLAISKHDSMLDYILTKLFLYKLGVGDSPTPLVVAARENTFSDGLRKILLEPLGLDQYIFSDSNHILLEGTRNLFEKMGGYKIPFRKMSPKESTVFRDYVMESCRSGENHLVYAAGGRDYSGNLPEIDKMSTGLVKILSFSVKSLGNELYKLGSQMRGGVFKEGDELNLRNLTTILKKREVNISESREQTRFLVSQMENFLDSFKDKKYYDSSLVLDEKIKELGREMLSHRIDLWILPICVNYANRPEENFFPFVRWAKEKKKKYDEITLEDPLPGKKTSGFFHLIEEKRRKIMRDFYYYSYIGADAFAFVWRYYRSKAGFSPNSAAVLSFGKPFNILERKDSETGKNYYLSSHEIMKRAYSEIESNHKKYSRMLYDWNFDSKVELDSSYKSLEDFL